MGDGMSLEDLQDYECEGQLSFSDIYPDLFKDIRIEKDSCNDVTILDDKCNDCKYKYTCPYMIEAMREIYMGD